MNAPFALPNFFPALPEIFLLAMGCVVMLADLYVKSERRAGSFLLAQATLHGCTVLSAFILVSTEGELIYSFSNLFVADRDVARAEAVCLHAAVSVALVYSRQYLLDLMRGEFHAAAVRCSA